MLQQLAGNTVSIFTYSYSVAQYGVSGWFYIKSARSEESLQPTHSESATFGGPVTLT